MSRRTALLVAVAAAAALAGSGAGTWVRARAWSPLDDGGAVVVNGFSAAPAIGAAALVAAAAGVLMALAGRRTGVLAGLTVAGAGALAAGAALVVATDPLTPVAATARATVGVAAVEDVRLGPWPWVAVVVGLLTVVAGVRVALAARRWALTSSRHDRHDRNDRHGAPTAGPSAGEPQVGPTRAGREPQADVVAWDALSRGEDPT